MTVRGSADTIWLALLRGINVGGRNVIFRSASSGPGALTARIEGMLAAARLDARVPEHDHPQMEDDTRLLQLMGGPDD